MICSGTCCTDINFGIPMNTVIANKEIKIQSTMVYFSTTVMLSLLTASSFWTITSLITRISSIRRIAELCRIKWKSRNYKNTDLLHPHAESITSLFTILMISSGFFISFLGLYLVQTSCHRSHDEKGNACERMRMETKILYSAHHTF